MGEVCSVGRGGRVLGVFGGLVEVLGDGDGEGGREDSRDDAN